MKFFAILVSVAFGIVILGISILQVRGLAPGQTAIGRGPVVNGELNLYLDDPKYFVTVLGERVKDFFTFGALSKARHRLFLASERFSLASELFSQGRTGLGLWSARKALVYQGQVIDLLPAVSDETVKKDLIEQLERQFERFGVAFDSQAKLLTGPDLAELDQLQKMLTDNTQRLVAFENQENQSK